ncbi:hypothetical protein ACLBXM_01710 [Xanthobacteraceae bacterium A53D]
MRPSRTSAAAVAKARAMHACGRKPKDIRAETGLTAGQIRYWTRREGTERAVDTPPRYPAAVTRVDGVAGRRQLIGRLWRAAEGQVSEIEARLGQADDVAPRDGERDARTLAVLARVMRELAALDAVVRGTAAKVAPDGAKGRDLDTFRRELATRLARISAKPGSGEAGPT